MANGQATVAQEPAKRAPSRRQVRAVPRKRAQRMLEGAQAGLKAIGSQFGFQPSDAGRTFKLGEVAYRLVGIKPDQKSFPVIAVEPESKRVFKLALAVVLTALQRKGSTSWKPIRQKAAKRGNGQQPAPAKAPQSAPTPAATK